MQEIQANLKNCKKPSFSASKIPLESPTLIQEYFKELKLLLCCVINDTEELQQVGRGIILI
jgi:hypothetical protein